MPSMTEAAALGTALSVAVSNLVATPATRHLGPFAFNRLRLLAALALLAAPATVGGGWPALSYGDLAALALSGLIGIVAGDTAIYAAMARIGPRRTGLLYATNAPIAAILGFLILDERLSAVKLAGMAAVIGGVWLAIAYRDGLNAASDRWEEIKGPPVVGIAFGLLGALGQAAAALIVRPVMQAGIDPAAAACVRIAVALVCLIALTALPRFRGHGPPTTRVLGLAALSGALGMGAGMTLLLVALRQGTVGVVTTLASTTPVMLLPLLWLVSGRRPPLPAWAGAALAVAGAGLLFGIV